MPRSSAEARAPSPICQRTPAHPPRILIIDDSAVARAVIGRMIEASRRFVVAGSVTDAQAALTFLRNNAVDAILLDIEMPGIDGLTALPDLIAAGLGARVLIVSSRCEEGAVTTIRALTLGAADTLAKPGASAFAGRFAEVLTDKLTRLLKIDDIARDARPAVSTRGDSDGFDIVAIGASTGGIHALSQLLREIPASFHLPILITQHLPESFMPYFATQIAALAGRPCDIATDGMRIRPGRVIIAPGGDHMRLVKLDDGDVAVRLSREPAKSGCMPSVDPMFESLAEVYGARVLAIVLSGMGRDGSNGAKRLADAGGCIVVQDRASSVVWGMPGTIASAGGADAILPPDRIGRLITMRRRP